MGRKLTGSEWEARAEAYTEAADHLDQEWTNSPTERKQGNIVSAELRRKAEECRCKSDATEPLS